MMYTFAKASTVCQWCGETFEIRQAPFEAKAFREWATTMRAHKVECKEKFLKSPAAQKGLNEAGLHFLSENSDVQLQRSI